MQSFVVPMILKYVDNIADLFAHAGAVLVTSFASWMFFQVSESSYLLRRRPDISGRYVPPWGCPTPRPLAAAHFFDDSIRWSRRRRGTKRIDVTALPTGDPTTEDSRSSGHTSRLSRSCSTNGCAPVCLSSGGCFVILSDSTVKRGSRGGLEGAGVPPILWSLCDPLGFY
eukprot:3435465-Pyramimonas_sp.AAC.1